MTDRLLGIKKDDLTNCYMKNGIFPLLQMLVDEYQTAKKPFSILLLDLDYFKTYNDTFGHLIGDEILKYFSSSVRLDLYGLENIPFRFGGDEFVVVFPGRLPIEVYPLVMRLRENMRKRQCLIKGNQIKLSFSAGISSYPEDADSIESLLENADKAMYLSKKRGRNRVTIYSKMWKDDRRKIIMGVLAVSALLLIGAVAYRWEDILCSLKSDTMTKKVAQTRRLLGEFKTQVQNKADAITRPITDVEPMNVGPLFGGMEKTDLKPLERPSQPSAVSRPAVAESAAQEITLKSGGIVKGIIIVETNDEIRVKLKVGEGEGTMRIKKANILKIE